MKRAPNETRTHLCRFAKEVLYIDQHILNETKTRRKNVWIYNRKANDMVSQSWIKDFHKIYPISDQVTKSIEKIMKAWRVELTAGRKCLTAVKIQWGMFQGDTLSPLVLVIVLIALNLILSKCTGWYKFTKLYKKSTLNVYVGHQTVCQREP